MRYLTAHDILIIHARIIEETGGADGVRDTHLLASAAERPKMRYDDKDLYPRVFEKAAAYLESLARHHVFVDGNKRTAIVVTARFLSLNDYELTATNHEVERFVLRVAIGKHEIIEIAAWFKNHSKRLKAH